MRILGLNLSQILYIIIASVVVAVIVFLLIFIPLRKKSIHKHHVEHDYKKVYQIAFNQDYYLINDFNFKTTENRVDKFEHIIVGDKFFYLINDYFYEGSISGSDKDSSLVYTNVEGAKKYTDNPIVRNGRLAQIFSLTANLDKDMIIGIVLVNDECKINVEHNYANFFIVNRKKLASLIKDIESRDVSKLNEKQVEFAVKQLSKMNRKKKNKKQ